MSFFALALKNLLRQRVRTSLTVFGIAIGIATVVALGAVTGGLRKTSGELVVAGGADFLVAQDGASDLTFSTVPVTEWRKLQGEAGVARASGFLLDIRKVGSKAYFPLFGYELSDLRDERLDLTAGRLARNPGELLLGEQGARDLGRALGDRFAIDRMQLRVVGIYRAADTFRNAGGIVSLEDAWRLTGKTGVLTGIHVKAAPGTTPAALAARIEREFPELAAIRTVDEYSKVDQGFKTLDALNLAISLLAVGIGAIGVMNTMIMSVFERTREFGILRAVGWRGSRIVRLIVLESLLLCVLAVVVGTAIGALASRAVLLIPAISSFLSPTYDTATFVRAAIVGVLVALAGAIYPVLRAVRLSPMESLRHE